MVDTLDNWQEVGESFPSCERLLVRDRIVGPAGLVAVVTDGVTITGDGTEGDPLSAAPPAAGSVAVAVDGVTITGDGTTGNPLSAAAAPGAASSGYLGRQVFAASGAYVPTPGTRLAIATAVGAGAGGGGVVASNVGEGCAAGGGGAGAVCVRRFGDGVAAIVGGAVVVGAGGAKGSDAGGNGGAGGLSSVAINGDTLNAGGGNPGFGQTLSSVGFSTLGASGGNGYDFVSEPQTWGAPGGAGLVVLVDGAFAIVAMSGAGGSTPYGGGGRSLHGAGSMPGELGLGRGSGGSGATSTNGSAEAEGGLGADGYVFIDEFGYV